MTVVSDAATATAMRVDEFLELVVERDARREELQGHLFAFHIDKLDRAKRLAAPDRPVRPTNAWSDRPGPGDTTVRGVDRSPGSDAVRSWWRFASIRNTAA